MFLYICKATHYLWDFICPAAQSVLLSGSQLNLFGVAYVDHLHIYYHMLSFNYNNCPTFAASKINVWKGIAWILKTCASERFL